MHRKRPEKQGIELKKKFGQHFLQDQFFIDQVINRIKFTPETNVFEIGCGEGVLTKAIAAQPLLNKLQVFEIDPEWANLVRKNLKSNPKVVVSQSNILDENLNELFQGEKWILLANLPYCITFPILHLLQQSSAVVKEGVIMIQEEVAQKIVQKSGRGYGYPSLFFQHYFSWELMDKVPPTAFFPPPKVFSRLLYFKTNENPEFIEHEEDFWKFIKACFLQPRRTLKNNLQQSKYGIEPFSEELLKKRAQELSMQDFLTIWKKIQSK
ncbi:MAG: ribosomal RNA small subunit methyltransferase A [Candidatus Dependentiae bacterium]|nr:ribosomal RNA small subunit methyltransferase A [Candidatus Dependentiae bacterium]